ncbi:MAG: hypothetical protein WCV68_01520 [Candidatus Paceibacterota bacterium]|jgi:hypothetical protein
MSINGQNNGLVSRHLEYASLPFDLEKNLWSRLSREQKRQAKIHLAAFFVLDGLALVGLISSVIYLSDIFSQSGFGQYLSLFLSDSNLLVSYWQEIVFSLAESLPVLGFIAFLSVTTVLIWSFAKTIINARLIMPARPRAHLRSGGVCI